MYASRMAIPSTSIKTIWATGFNSSGNFGDLTTVNKSSPVQITTASLGMSASQSIISMVCGGTNTMILRSDYTLWICGGNNLGQLGDSTTTNRASYIQVTAGTGSFTQMASGLNFNVAIDTNGTLWTWGQGNVGQLGTGTTANRSSPASLGTGFVKVACGNSHTIALKTDNNVYSWGLGSPGQLGSGATTNRSSPVAVSLATTALDVFAGANNSMILGADRLLYTFGEGTYGTLGSGLTTNRSTATAISGISWGYVSMGYLHALGVTTGGTLYLWGYNANGQLGNSSTVSRSAPTQISFPDARFIAANGSKTVLFKNNNELWIVGANGSGEYGNNSVIARSSPIQIGTYTGIPYVAKGGNTGHLIWWQNS